MSENIDFEKVGEMAGKLMGHVAGAVSVMMAYMGDQAGVWAAMDGAGPLTWDELAAKTGLEPKYLREWLGSVAAAGYVVFDGEKETFELTPEAAMIFTREGQPMCMQGFLQAVVAQYDTHEKAVEVFKTGVGRPWSDHSQCLFCGTDRFFRPGYAANLVSSWLPALDGVTDKLEAGAKVADIGCGYGSSTVLMAKNYPNPPSSASTSMSRASSRRASRRKRPVSPMSPSKWPRRRTSRATLSTSPASSMRCTTWAIRWARRAISARP